MAIRIMMKKKIKSRAFLLLPEFEINYNISHIFNDTMILIYDMLQEI